MLAAMPEEQQVGIRKMKLEDIPVICEIEQECFTAPWSAEAFHHELIQNHFAHYYILEVNGAIAGYGGMWIIMDEAHVTNIAVRGKYRGKGCGELLLRKLQQSAVALGSVRMTLEVRVSNEVAQNLYRKLGFREAGIRKNYYSDNQEDALIMWAELNIQGS
ncbi:ribosomal protein S18-alanine N-acetyltransferase [Marinicrinis lubricantis]|uniref:Ribosomal protein S18-alanine N-acetyltransferase n=1 Tax=Marinicrinis lubricantis TaxID=2086470 RepID=A0ABW1IR87_9BACL